MMREYQKIAIEKIWITKYFMEKWLCHSNCIASRNSYLETLMNHRSSSFLSIFSVINGLSHI